jgi:hypothetical protein
VLVIKEIAAILQAIAKSPDGFSIPVASLFFIPHEARTFAPASMPQMPWFLIIPELGWRTPDFGRIPRGACGQDAKPMR